MTTAEADGGTGVLAGEARLLIDGELAGAAGGATFDVINPATEEAGYWPGYARDFAFLRDAGTDSGLGRTFRQQLQYIPVGVVAAITPWNAPLYLNVAESVPALLAGNAVILKRAQLTPWAGLELGRIAAEETDLPPGIFQVVVSNDNDVAAVLTSDPRVDMVTFTGSTAVGRKILAAAATVKKTVMELGGKSTHIVLDDADLATVLPLAAGGVCTMSGQGLPRGYYIEPTLLSDVDPRSAIGQEETFGPGRHGHPLRH